MRRLIFLLVFLCLAAPVAAKRQAIGIFGSWGAFQDSVPDRCFAIAKPLRGLRPVGWEPFASVSYWPKRGIRAQVQFRLSREKRQGSAILLRIDDRVFQLAGAGANAWASDRRTNAAIIAAMRTGIDMNVETRSISGGLVRDFYKLRGAASAIDAAAIACAR